MKCKIPEISWHNRDPVLSVDIQPKNEKSSLYRLASGGTDSHVLIWNLSFTDTGEVNLDVAADLTRHQRAVNVVKWSPNGEFLASGDDESVVFIWKQKEESEHVMLDSINENDKETWITLKVLRGHMEDVYDLSWAPNSQFLVSGSVDNTAIVWDVNKGKSVSILKDHKGFVQGVAWDPQNQYIATLSTDRILRIFDIQTKKIVQRISKSTLPVLKDNDLFEKKVRLYHDDTLQTFFRRLCFSPDGKLLFTPAGVADYDGATNLVHTSYIYSRFSLKQPSLVLPSPDQYTVAIQCCPILFKLRNKADPKTAVIPLPYRMIFAIATKSSVYLYDTQQKVPFGLISNIHYTRLTDIAWSSDGRIMIVSSTDGFCSMITFDEGELGEVYEDVNILQPMEKTFDKKSNKSKIRESATVNKQLGSENIAPKIRNNEENPKFPLEKISHDLIIDKDIISSDEKFESPEKKARIATPILIRRHPRTSNSASGTQGTNGVSSLLQNPSVSTPEKSGIRKATPIAIRRTPRILIPTSVEKTIIGEEAMDSWPSKMNSPPKPETKENLDISEEQTKEETKETNDCTEDIRLVYEETADEIMDESVRETIVKSSKQIEASDNSTEVKNEKELSANETVKELSFNEFSKESLNTTVDKQIQSSRKIEQTEKSKNIQATPEQKNKRRAELKTISTPKSRKKILE